MKKLRTYKATLFHDQGRVTYSFLASGNKAAIDKILKAENCPKSAIRNLGYVHICSDGNAEFIPVKVI